MSRHINWGDLTAFAARCEQLDIEVPEPLARGLHLRKVAVAAAVNHPLDGLLELDDKQALKLIKDLAIRRHNGRGAGGAFVSSDGMEAGVQPFVDQLAREVYAAMLPELEQIVLDLQPEFDRRVAPLVDAVTCYGFTAATTESSVIDMDFDAIVAFRSIRTAWLEIQPIASFRIEMSRVFGVSPTPQEIADATGLIGIDAQRANYSVAFAAGNTWSLDDGYLIEGRRGNHIDWLALASGGLRLNTPAETRAKIVARRND